LAVEDHFAITAGIIAINVNAEYNNTFPAPALIQSSALMTRPHVEADRPVGPEQVIF
jgi:hypothetical protein